jgi:drug/metabolite transporter (DMT)-like permease
MDKKGVGLVVATALISGFSVWLNAYGVKGLDASFFTAAKNILVALLLVVTILAMREYKSLRALTLPDWLKLMLIGLVGGSLPFLLFFNGLKMSSAATGSLIRTSMLLFVVVFATFFLKERLTKAALAGSLLLILGSALLFKLQGFSLGLGELLILLATILWAAETVLSKHVLKLERLSGKIVALGRMGFGSVFLLGYLIFTDKASLFSTTDARGWLWIGITSALLFGYVLTFYEGLKRVPAVAATAVLMLGPVITVLLDFASKGTIGSLQIIGCVLAVTGAVLITRTALPSLSPAPQ